MWTSTAPTDLLVILPLSLAVRDESSAGASGEWESACARLCCSKLYSLSSANNVPMGARAGDTFLRNHIKTAAKEKTWMVQLPATDRSVCTECIPDVWRR